MMLIDEMVERLDMAEHRIERGWTVGNRNDRFGNHCLVGAIEIAEHEHSPLINLLHAELYRTIYSLTPHAELYRTIYSLTPLTTIISDVEHWVWGWNDLQTSSEPVLLVIRETRERISGGGLGAPISGGKRSIEERVIEARELRKKYPKISALDLRHVKSEPVEPVKSYISELRETDLAIAGD